MTSLFYLTPVLSHLLLLLYRMWAFTWVDYINGIVELTASGSR